MGMMGGMQVDIASSMNFVQSVTELFECDPPPECSPNDEHTLDAGGSGAVNEPNCAAIAEAAENAAQTEEEPPETREVPIRNRRGRITGYRTEIVS